MDRRSFLKITAMASVATLAPTALADTSPNIQVTGLQDFIRVRTSEKQSAPIFSLNSESVSPLVVVIPHGRNNIPLIKITYAPAQPFRSLTFVTVRARCVDSNGAEALLNAGQSQPLVFNAGENQAKATFLSFNNSAFSAVTRQSVTLIWEVDDGSGWRAVAKSKHVLYVLAGKPQDPWIEPVNEESLSAVWTDVLDVACVWAQGAKSETDIGCLIAKQLFNYAQQPSIQQPSETVFSYIDSGPESSSGNYTSPDYYDRLHNTASVHEFHLTDFLQRLTAKGGVRGPNIACFDCSSAVVTFSNALGAHLEPIDFFPAPGALEFPVRNVRLIGQTSIKNVVFSSHSVAALVGNTRTASDSSVFDACLAIGGNQVPCNMPMNAYINAISDAMSVRPDFSRQEFALMRPTLKQKFD